MQIPGPIPRGTTAFSTDGGLLRKASWAAKGPGQPLTLPGPSTLPTCCCSASPPRDGHKTHQQGGTHVPEEMASHDLLGQLPLQAPPNPDFQVAVLQEADGLKRSNSKSPGEQVSWTAETKHGLTEWEQERICSVGKATATCVPLGLPAPWQCPPLLPRPSGQTTPCLRRPPSIFPSWQKQCCSKGGAGSTQFQQGPDKEILVAATSLQAFRHPRILKNLLKVN